MVKADPKERRSWVRAKRVLSIQYRLSQSKRKSVSKEWNLSTTQDMSLGGLTFYTDAEYKAGDVLEIHVVMSGILDIFKGFGKVVRAQKKKSGGYFTVAIKFLENKTKVREAKSYRSTTKKKATTTRKRI